MPLSVGEYRSWPPRNRAKLIFIPTGIPLSPMLGSITRSLNEVYTRLGNLPFTAEAKLDGQRVQLHARLDGPSGADDGGGRWVESKMGGQKVWVRLFSRYVSYTITQAELCADSPCLNLVVGIWKT